MNNNDEHYDVYDENYDPYGYDSDDEQEEEYYDTGEGYDPDEYSPDEIRSMYRDAFEDDPEAEWGIMD